MKLGFSNGSSREPVLYQKARPLHKHSKKKGCFLLEASERSRGDKDPPRVLKISTFTAEKEEENFFFPPHHNNRGDLFG